MFCTSPSRCKQCPVARRGPAGPSLPPTPAQVPGEFDVHARRARATRPPEQPHRRTCCRIAGRSPTPDRLPTSTTRRRGQDGTARRSHCAWIPNAVRDIAADNLQLLRQDSLGSRGTAGRPHRRLRSRARNSGWRRGADLLDGADTCRRSLAVAVGWPTHAPGHEQPFVLADPSVDSRLKAASHPRASFLVPAQQESGAGQRSFVSAGNRPISDSHPTEFDAREQTLNHLT